MKNSNPVSPVILEGDPVELTITNAGVTTAGEYFQSGTLSGSVLTLNVNPNTSNFSISSSGSHTKDIVLLRPVSSQETRRLIAKNGCMVTFFGKAISSGAVNIKFESFSDITKASTPVSSYALTNNEYITFIFVKDSWRLVSEISPASLSSTTSLQITGSGAAAINLTAQGAGITFNSNTATSVLFAPNGTATLGAISVSNARVSGSYSEQMTASDILSILGSDAQSVSTTNFSTATKFIQVAAAATNESVQLTFPTAAQVLAASTGSGKQTPIADTTFFFSVANTSTGTGNVTIQTTNFADTFGSRSLASQTSAMFAYRFTNVTSGTEAAILYRMS